MNRVLKMVVFLVLLFSALFAEQIRIDDPLDFRILEQFFRTMMSDDDYGYVIDGVKPISVREFGSPEHLPLPHSPMFSSDICAMEVIEVWNRVRPKKVNITLKTTKIFNAEADAPRVEFLFINSKELLKAIESNINLFRYVLGPSLGAKDILKYIVEFDVSLSDILKKDLVLTGIVLGFGAYNSLMYSRTEMLQNSQCNPDIPPFSSRFGLLFPGLDSLREHAIFFSYINGSIQNRYQPNRTHFVHSGLGFKCTKDELNFINSQQIDLPKSLTEETPRFIFGAYKNEGAQSLIDRLKLSQERIKFDLNRPDFLELVLEKISGEKPIIECSLRKSIGFPLKGDVEKAVAKVIWSNCSQLGSDLVSEFIGAFCRKDHQEQQEPKLYLMPGSLTGFRLAQNNLRFAEEQLATCSSKEHLEEVVLDRIYFERLETGSGNCLGTADELLLSYVMEDGRGRILSANHNCSINLSETVPGFALGIEGMKEGETRKIYIHPAYGYGVNTTLPPCTFLTAKVTLHRINSHTQYTCPPLDPIDLSWLKNPELFQEFEQSSQQTARYLGSKWGVWLSTNSSLNFQKLCKELKNLNQTQDLVTLPVTDEERKTCNQLFWNLSFSSLE